MSLGPWTSLWDRIAIADPDGSRLRMGARATLASAATALVLSEVAGKAGLPLTFTMVGAFVAMLATALVTDAAPRDQRVTSLLLAFPATAALVTGTLVAPFPFASLPLFGAVIFVAVAARRFGPRGTALGTLGFNAFFFALFFQARRADLPWMTAAVVAATAIAYVVRHGILPDRPEAQIRRALQAYRAMLVLVLGRTAKAMSSSWKGVPVRRLRGALDRLNEMALLLEDLAHAGATASPGHGERALIQSTFELELAAGRVVSAARAIATRDSPSAESRSALSRALVHASRALRGSPDAAGSMQSALEEARRATSPAARDPLSSLRAQKLEEALNDLLRTVEEPSPEEEEVSDTALGAGPQAPRTPPLGPGLHPATKQAIQATMAGALSMAVGYLISPSRWFWAVLTAFLVLTRATTVDEILARAWSRTAGTVIGIFFGMGLATAIHGYPRLELGLMFVCVFFAFYFLRTSYATMVVWITGAVALLYSLLGRYSPALLYVRLEETLAGAVIGTAVAAAVFPSRTGSKVRLALAALFTTLATFLESVLALESPARAGALFDGARALDRQLRDIRAAAEPLTRRLVPIESETVRLLRGASVLVFHSRQLASPKLLGNPTEDAPEPLRKAAARLGKNARVLAAALSGSGSLAGELLSGDPATGDPPFCSAPPSEGTRQSILLLYWLRRMDETMQDLAETLGLSVQPASPD